MTPIATELRYTWRAYGSGALCWHVTPIRTLWRLDDGHQVTTRLGELPDPDLFEAFRDD